MVDSVHRNDRRYNYINNGMITTTQKDEQLNEIKEKMLDENPFDGSWVYESSNGELCIVT